MCRHRSWASGPQRRLEAKESAAKEVLRAFVDRPRPEPPLQTTAAPSPLTGVEAPRHIRHFPGEDEAGPPQPPIADIDPGVAPDNEATRALVRKLMTDNMELRIEIGELRLEHKKCLLELELELRQEMRESERETAEREREWSEATKPEMDRLLARSPLDAWLEDYGKANWETLIQALDLGLIPPSMWPQQDQEEYEANKLRLWEETEEGHRLLEQFGLVFECGTTV